MLHPVKTMHFARPWSMNSTLFIVSYCVINADSISLCCRHCCGHRHHKSYFVRLFLEQPFRYVTQLSIQVSYVLDTMHTNLQVYKVLTGTNLQVYKVHANIY